MVQVDRAPGDDRVVSIARSGVGRPRRGLDRELPGVLEQPGPGGDTGRESLFLHQTLVEARRAAVAQERTQDGEGIRIRVAERRGLIQHEDLGLGGKLDPYAPLAGLKRLFQDRRRRRVSDMQNTVCPPVRKREGTGLLQQVVEGRARYES